MQQEISRYMPLVHDGEKYINVGRESNCRKSEHFHLVLKSPISCLAVLALPVNGGKGRSELAVKMSCLQTALGLTPPWSQLALRQPCTWPVNLFHLIARESGVIFPQLALAQSDSHFFSGSYRNWRQQFSLCTEGSAQQGGSVE